MMKRVYYIFTMLIFSSLLAACADGVFAKKDNAQKPAALANFNAERQVAKSWEVNIGKSANRKYSKLHPTTAQGVIYAASVDGKLTAVSADSGAVLWEKETGLAISSGPSLAGKMLVVGTSDAQVAAFSINKGEKLWSADVPNEVLAQPVINKQQVLVKTIDGNLLSLNSKDGQQQWVYAHGAPSLILHASSAPQVAGDLVIAGFNDGKLVGLTVADGSLQWKSTISKPKGTTVVARMVDINADPLVVGNKVFVASYQGALAAVNVKTGAILWPRPMSSYSGIAAKNGVLYVSDSEGSVWAIDQKRGHTVWKQDKLQARMLTAPVLSEEMLVVGDREGHLHWLAQNDGRFIARIRADNRSIIHQPTVVDNRVFVLGRHSQLMSFTVS